jgi:hypothetical protein
MEDEATFFSNLRMLEEVDDGFLSRRALISGFNLLNSFQHFSKAFLLLGLICSKTSSSEKIFFSILQQQITNQSKSSVQTDPCLFVVCERVHLVNRTPRKPRPSPPHPTTPPPTPHHTPPPNFPEDILMLFSSIDPPPPPTHLQ